MAIFKDVFKATFTSVLFYCLPGTNVQVSGPDFMVASCCETSADFYGAQQLILAISNVDWLQKYNSC